MQLSASLAEERGLRSESVPLREAILSLAKEGTADASYASFCRAMEGLEHSKIRQRMRRGVKDPSITELRAVLDERFVRRIEAYRMLYPDGESSSRATVAEDGIA